MAGTLVLFQQLEGRVTDQIGIDFDVSHTTRHSVTNFNQRSPHLHGFAQAIFAMVGRALRSMSSLVLFASTGTQRRCLPLDWRAQRRVHRHAAGWIGDGLAQKGRRRAVAGTAGLLVGRLSADTSAKFWSTGMRSSVIGRDFVPAGAHAADVCKRHY